MKSELKEHKIHCLIVCSGFELREYTCSSDSVLDSAKLPEVDSLSNARD